MSIIKKVTFEEEMKKNPELKLSDIQSLREWCEKQPHLPKIEDFFLVLFLHRKYYQMEPTKNIIENYYTMRTHIPEFFCNRDPLEEKGLRQAIKTTTLVPLNGTTKDGYRMLYGTFLDPDPSSFDFNDCLKYATMLGDKFFLIDGTCKGYIFIADYSKLSFDHITRISPLGIKKYLHYIQEGAPIHVRGIHVINVLPAMEFLLNMIKPFLRKKLKDTMHVHSSLESFSKYIPVDALPNEVGGKAGSIYELAEIQVKEIESYREWFLLDETSRRVNEALRMDKSTSTNYLFGVEGSFKKLDID